MAPTRHGPAGDVDVSPTGLYHAVVHNHVDAARVLLDQGQDPILVRACLETACSNKHRTTVPAAESYTLDTSEMVRLLLRYNTQPLNNNLLCIAIRSGRANVLPILLDAGAQFDGKEFADILWFIMCDTYDADPVSDDRLEVVYSCAMTMLQELIDHDFGINALFNVRLMQDIFYCKDTADYMSPLYLLTAVRAGSLVKPYGHGIPVSALDRLAPQLIAHGALMGYMDEDGHTTTDRQLDVLTRFFGEKLPDWAHMCYRWTPPMHRHAPEEVRGQVLVMMTLARISPVFADIPVEVMCLFFEELCEAWEPDCW